MNNETNKIMTWNEALDHYGLNYNVEKRPLYLNNGQEVSNLYSIVRTDTEQPLSGVAVNGRYTCIQTSEYADIGNRICGQLGCTFVNGGSLLNGRGLFLQAKLPDSFRVKGTNDQVNKNLTFLTSHDGSLCFTILSTMLRLFCANQFAALQDNFREGLKVRHTSTAEQRLANADKAVLDIMNAYKVFEQKIDWLADQRFTDLQLDIACKKVFGVKDDQEIATKTKNNIDKVKELFTEGQGQHMFQGSAWSAFNAFTEYSDHERTVRGSKDKAEKTRFESGLIGVGSVFKIKALNAIEETLGVKQITSLHAS